MQRCAVFFKDGQIGSVVVSDEQSKIPFSAIKRTKDLVNDDRFLEVGGSFSCEMSTFVPVKVWSHLLGNKRFYTVFIEA
jgi:hypothetical protein